MMVMAWGWARHPASAPWSEAGESLTCHGASGQPRASRLGAEPFLQGWGCRERPSHLLPGCVVGAFAGTRLCHLDTAWKSSCLMACSPWPLELLLGSCRCLHGPLGHLLLEAFLGHCSPTPHPSTTFLTAQAALLVDRSCPPASSPLPLLLRHVLFPTVCKIVLICKRFSGEIW